jgi:hypothetical protein
MKEAIQKNLSTRQRVDRHRSGAKMGPFIQLQLDLRYTVRGDKVPVGKMNST